MFVRSGILRFLLTPQTAVFTHSAVSWVNLLPLDAILRLKLFPGVPHSIGLFRTIVCYTVCWKRSIYPFSVSFCWESPVFYYTCLDRALPLYLCNLYTQSHCSGSPISPVGTGAFLEVVVLGILHTVIYDHMILCIMCKRTFAIASSRRSWSSCWFVYICTTFRIQWPTEWMGVGHPVIGWRPLPYVMAHCTWNVDWKNNWQLYCNMVCGMLIRKKLAIIM